jgi:hypothetical protein
LLKALTVKSAVGFPSAAQAKEVVTPRQATMPSSTKCVFIVFFITFFSFSNYMFVVVKKDAGHRMLPRIDQALFS